MTTYKASGPPGESKSIDQQTVRIFLASLFLGVLYLFGSLAVLVVTAHDFCDRRTSILAYALLGFLLAALTMWSAWNRSGSARFIFVLPATFFVLGTGIPVWLVVHAAKVCAAQAGR